MHIETLKDMLARTHLDINNGGPQDLLKKQAAALTTAIAALSQGSEPAGVGDWVSAPREPTAAMMVAGRKAHHEAEQAIEGSNFTKESMAYRATRAAYVYKAMLDAAPAPAQQVSDEMVERAFAAMRRFDCFFLFDDDVLRDLVREWLTAALQPPTAQGDSK